MPIEITSNTGAPEQAKKAQSAESASETAEKNEAVTDENVENETEQSAGPETEGEENEEGGKEAASDEKTQKKSKGVEKRIKELNRNWREQQRENQALRAKLEALEAGRNQTQSPESKAQDKSGTSEGKRPKASDFETFEEYEAALEDYHDKRFEERFTAQKKREQEERLASEMADKTRQLQKRIDEFADEHDDYFDVAASVSAPPLGLFQEFQDSKYGVEIFYDLAKNNPEEYERICKLPYAQQVKAFGKLEDKYEAKNTPSKEAKKSNAPEPIKPVGARSSGAVRKSIYDPEISQSDYEALRREQMKRRAAWG